MGLSMHVPGPSLIQITGVTEPTILRYFETMNAGEFTLVSQLFATDGVLHPPFEEGIVGPEAIASYLQAEAQGFQLHPREGMVQSLDGGYSQVELVGRVQTALFSVNVAWLFVLNADQEIVSVRIKLLASPQELLSLRR